MTEIILDNLFIFCFIAASIVFVMSSLILKRGDERSEIECQKSFADNFLNSQIEQEKRKNREYELKNPDVFSRRSWSKILESNDKYKTMNGDFTASARSSTCYGSIGIDSEKKPYRIHIDIFCNVNPEIRDRHEIQLTSVGSVLSFDNQVLHCDCFINDVHYDSAIVECALNKNGEIIITHHQPSELETDCYHIEGFVMADELPILAQQ